MRKNLVKQKWANNDFAINGWLHIPAGWSAEVMANAEYDSLCIDMQHGQLGFPDVMEMLRAISTTDTVPLVRVPWNEPGIIGRVLDAGAYGVICPMVNTKAECEQFVGACRYHPEGIRSRGPTRASIYGGSDYVHHANDEIITMAMIETTEALANVDAIVSVPGLDAVYVGPGDLSLTLLGMERSGIDLDDAEFIAVLEKIATAAKNAGVVAGIHTNSPAYAKRMVEMGFRFTTMMTDTLMLRTMATQKVSELRGEAFGTSGDIY
ncbi:MAG: aldolase/citrate lyase family protein [Chloroflexota bacterium]